MFSSTNPEGSDAWYDDLEAWMRSQEIPATNENIFLECERIMREVGHFIQGDLRFFHELERRDAEAARRAS